MAAPPHRVALLGALCFAAAGAPARAQNSAQAGRGLTTLDGVYTESQARKGEATYQKHCTACHVPASITGIPFRRAWTGRTVFELFDLVRTTMPQDDPGQLSQGQYAEILAYLFKLNGFPPGPKSLPTNEEALKVIRIEAEAPPDGGA